jgi:hypothetical protein
MWVEFKPKHPRYTERIYSSMSPPSRFVTAAVDFAVMPATERNDKLITHLAGQRMMDPSASTPSSANAISGSSIVTGRSRGRSRPSKNFSITTSPAKASWIAVRSSASV